MTLSSSFSTLARAVAQGTQPSDLLPDLHREVLAAAGGTSSVLLQPTRSGEYAAASGEGIDSLGEVWLSAGEAHDIAELSSDGIALLSFKPGSPLGDRLKAADALAVSIPGAGADALLVIAAPLLPEPEARNLGARARVEFGVVRELTRLSRAAAFHRQIQELLLGFSRGVSATVSLPGALGALVRDINVLFGTRRTSVWLLDRRPRELVLTARSPTASGSPESHQPGRVGSAGDSTAARGLRLDLPQIVVHDDGEPVLVAPLRGLRRALGTVVIEGEPSGIDDRQFADAAYDLARQLSVALESVQLLEEVLRQRRLLEDTFNSLLDLVVVADSALRVVQVNDAFAKRTGLDRGAFLDRPLSDFVGPKLLEWVAAPDAVPEPGTDSSPTAARTRQVEDARLAGIFSATVTPLISEHGEPIGRVLVARDITGQTRLEREREVLRQRLVQSEKLASLGQFVAGIAHEMNNPLQGVLGHLELLIDTSEAAKPIRPTLRRIYQEGDRAAKIVRNLLVFTGAQRMVRHRIRIESVLSRALASRRAALTRGRIQVVRSQEAVPHIAGDALLLQQALLNVLINAEHSIADTGQPGRIDITIAPGADAGSVVLTVSDTGSGVPAELLPRIFDPFFTTKEVGKGTGLGLAITYGIIQEHGGTIQAANRPEGGARFTLEFPAAESRSNKSDKVR